MIPIAPGDEVAIDPVLLAVLDISDPRRISGDVAGHHVGGLVDDDASPGFDRRVQIRLDFGLSVGHERRARVLLNVDEQALAITPSDGAARPEGPFPVHALAHSRVTEDLDRPPLQDAGTDPRQHVFSRLPLQDDALDPVEVESLVEKQARRTATDDRYLSPHLRPSRFPV